MVLEIYMIDCFVWGGWLQLIVVVTAFVLVERVYEVGLAWFCCWSFKFG